MYDDDVTSRLPRRIRPSRAGRTWAALAGLLAGAVVLVSGWAGPAAADTSDEWGELSAGGVHTCAIRIDQRLYCWGANGDGRLGVGDRDDRTTPARVGSATDWFRVFAGGEHTCGLRGDDGSGSGALYCWGSNRRGQLGLGDTADRDTPQRVGTSRWRDVLPGASHTCAIRSDGRLFCWGYTGAGILGDGGDVVSEQLTPAVVGSSTWTSLADGTGVEYFACAVRSDAKGYCWGSGVPGQPYTARTMTRISTESWSQLAFSHDSACGVSTSNRLYCWGGNTAGQLGLGDTEERDVPTKVVANDWRQVTMGGMFTCGIERDGETEHRRYCWGANTLADLGLGTVDDWNDWVTTPRRRTAETRPWGLLSAGWDHGCAIRRDDDRLYCWGDNRVGQLGLGDTTTRTTPTRVTT